MFSNPEAKILIVGLDNAGKSTLICRLQPDKYDEDVAATVGFSQENFTKNNIDFTAFDMSGQGKYRDMWQRFYDQAEAIIFVVDASDQLRVRVAKNELDMLLEDQGLQQRDVPILFFANKMDLGESMSVNAVSESLELFNINDRKWHIQACSAKTGKGVDAGMDWVVKNVENRI